MFALRIDFMLYK